MGLFNRKSDGAAPTSQSASSAGDSGLYGDYWQEAQAIIAAARANDDETVDAILAKNQHRPGFMQAALDVGIDLWAAEDHQAGLWVLIGLLDLDEVPPHIYVQGLHYRAWCLDSVGLEDRAIEDWQEAASLGYADSHYLLALTLTGDAGLEHLRQAAALGHEKAAEDLRERGLDAPAPGLGAGSKLGGGNGLGNGSKLGGGNGLGNGSKLGGLGDRSPAGGGGGFCTGCGTARVPGAAFCGGCGTRVG